MEIWCVDGYFVGILDGTAYDRRGFIKGGSWCVKCGSGHDCVFIGRFDMLGKVWEEVSLCNGWNILFQMTAVTEWRKNEE